MPRGKDITIHVPGKPKKGDSIDVSEEMKRQREIRKRIEDRKLTKQLTEGDLW